MDSSDPSSSEDEPVVKKEKRLRWVIVVNPNSSFAMTSQAKDEVDAMPSVQSAAENSRIVFDFVNGPIMDKYEEYRPIMAAPISIDDPITEVQSAAATWHLLDFMYGDTRGKPDEHPAAFLVSCFSDHPLTGMLAHAFPSAVVTNILRASVVQALAAGPHIKFGILTTTQDLVDDIERGVSAVLGAAGNPQYVGTVATGMTAIELKRTKKKALRPRLLQGIEALLLRGTACIILGCAAMPDISGMVQEAQGKLKQEGRISDKLAAQRVRIISGVQAGASQILALLESEP